MRIILRPLLFLQSFFYLALGELNCPPVQWAVIIAGSGLLGWSIIYGLERFDVWEGNELSYVAVGSIVAGINWNIDFITSVFISTQPTKVQLFSSSASLDWSQHALNPTPGPIATASSSLSSSLSNVYWQSWQSSSGEGYLSEYPCCFTSSSFRFEVEQVVISVMKQTMR